MELERWRNKKTLPQICLKIHFTLIGILHTQMLHVWHLHLHLIIFGVHVGKYAIHGASGIEYVQKSGQPQQLCINFLSTDLQWMFSVG